MAILTIQGKVKNIVDGDYTNKKGEKVPTREIDLEQSGQRQYAVVSVPPSKDFKLGDEVKLNVGNSVRSFNGKVYQKYYLLD